MTVEHACSLSPRTINWAAAFLWIAYGKPGLTDEGPPEGTRRAFVAHAQKCIIAIPEGVTIHDMYEDPELVKYLTAFAAAAPVPHVVPTT